MMKPTVDKVLKDVQLLSKRMRTREAFADELLNKIGTLQTNLESMRAVRGSLFIVLIFCSLFVILVSIERKCLPIPIQRLREGILETPLLAASHFPILLLTGISQCWAAIINILCRS